MRPKAWCVLAIAVTLGLLSGGNLPAQTSTTDQQALRQYLEDARRLMRAGDYHGAIAQYRHAARISPGNAEIQDRLGWCYLRTDQLRYAEQTFAKALSAEPTRTGSRKGLGLARYRLGEYAECVRTLTPALDDLGYDPAVQLIYGRSLLYTGHAAEALPHLRSADVPSRPDPVLLLSIAQTYQQLDQPRQAEAYYERVLALEPKHGAAMKGLLAAYKATKRWPEARQLVRQLLADAPNDPMVLRELAGIDRQLGLDQEALDIYERLTRLVEGEQALQLHAELAETYMKAGQAGLARPHFEAAIVQHANSAKLRARLAECLITLGEFAEAERQYGYAAAIEPQVAEWRFARGKLLMELGRSGEALETYQAGLALEPENVTALAAVADLARDLQKPELARDTLIILAAARPSNINIRLALSDVYRELGDVRAANVQAYEVLRADPDNIEARHRLAKTASDLGDFAGAIGHLKAIRVVDSTQTYYLSPMGRLLALQGQLYEAIHEYELLLQRDPDSVLVKSDLAAYYIQARQLDKARPLLNSILAQRPDSTWALDRLARCEELDGNWDAALELRRTVARMEPDVREHLDALVKIYERSGQAHLATDYLVTLMAVPNPPQEAVRVFVETYRRHSGAKAALEQIRGLADIFHRRPIFMRVAAETCAEEGLNDEALVRYAHYLYREPDDYAALTGMVALGRETNGLSRCQEPLVRYVERNPRAEDALILLTHVSLDLGRPMDAFGAVTRAVDLDDGTATGHRLLAEVLARLYGTPKAAEVMRQRAEASYGPAPRIGLAYALVLDGDPEEALTVLAASVETQHTAAEAAYVAGLAKNAMGLHRDAVAELSRAAADDNAPPDFRVALARALALSGQAESALWEYSQLLEDRASEGQGINGIRTLLTAKAVSTDAAAEALRRAGIDRGPSRALVALLGGALLTESPAAATSALRDIAAAWRGSELAWASLADAYQMTAQPEAEAAALVNLIDMRPGDTRLHLRLARAHERAGTPSRAVDAYAMALAFDPDNAEAAAALDRLLEAERSAPPQTEGPPAPPPLTPAPSSSPFLAASDV